MTSKRQSDLTAMRRTLIMAMWLDYKLFGYTTQTVAALQKRIVRAKQDSKITKCLEGIQFPNGLPPSEPAEDRKATGGKETKRAA